VCFYFVVLNIKRKGDEKIEKIIYSYFEENEIM